MKIPTMSPDSVISKIYGPLQTIVREAGEFVRNELEKKHTYTYKSDGSFATEVDIAVELLIKKKLKALLSEAAFIAEESGEEQSNSPWCWVIDPIDGTTNFSRSLPLFALSIALTHDNLPVIGMTYDPLRNELFHAAKGKGFFVNETQQYVSSRDLPESLIAFDLPLHPSSLSLFLNTLERLAPSVYAIRKLGSACLDLAYAASGRVDGVLLGSFKWWDVAAGILFIQEAGGLSSTFKGGAVDRESQSCIAANSLIFNAFRDLLP